MSNISGRYGCIGACASLEQHPFRQGESMALTQIRCADCGGKNVDGDSTYPIKDGEPRTMYHGASCGCSFSETKPPPLAHVKTPIAGIVPVLSALTEGVGIHAATRLYGVSKNRIYRWQERLSGLKQRSSCWL
jgi:transposase-like protein